MMASNVICNICGSETKTLQVKEMMLGLHETFTYYQCVNCGHAHLDKIPSDISRYYNTNEYYSFNRAGGGGVQAQVQRLLFKLHMVNNPFFSRSMQGLLNAKEYDKNDRILDYGCGAGYFVDELQQLGFRNAKGYDPYLPVDKSNERGIYLSKDIAALGGGEWDVVTLNHVFEHLPDPVDSLRTLKGMLKPGGMLVMRFPVIDSYAFKKYGVNWVQFDAPRHFNLFTRKSIRLVIEKINDLKLVDMYDDSFHFQFTGSELYLKKSSLHSRQNSRLKRILNLSTYKYHFLAKKLNRRNEGDQIVVAIEKTIL